MNLPNGVVNAHSIDYLISQIPSNINNLLTVPGRGPDWTSLLQNTSQGAVQSAGDYLYTTPVTPQTPQLFDPPAGTDLKFMENSSSPNISSVTLPIMNGVTSYNVRYHANGAWSAIQSLQPGTADNLPSGVDGVDFAPVGQSGQPMTISDFYFQATFSSAGTVSATLTEVQPLPGDANGDGTVDINDLTIVLSNFGQVVGADAWGLGDFNDNGAVDVNDLTILLTNFGRTASAHVNAVPEPSAATLLGIGAVGLLAFACRKRLAAAGGKITVEQ